MLEYDIIWGYHKMVVRTPRIVGRHIIIPQIVKSSGGSGKQWTLFVILFFLSALLAMASTGLEVDESQLNECNNEYDIYGEYSEECAELNDDMGISETLAAFSGCFCCSSIIVGIIASSASNASTKTVIVNQGYVPQTKMVQPQTTMVKPQLQVVRKGSVVKPAMTGKMPLEAERKKSNYQSNYQAPTTTAQPARTVQPKPNNQTSAPSMDEIDKLAQEAKNLELARDFTKAAEMYQKAGLFAEAGRIRQTYLENDKPIVQIGQIGDSVVKDSVIIGEQKSNLCPSCGVVTQPEWNFCPSCNSPL